MVSKIEILQMPSFKKAYKKLLPDIKFKVDEAIHAIIADPKLGEEKKGDLAGIFVYKFIVNKQEILLAYEWNPILRVLLALGVHENFYRDLKRKVKVF
ncbi:MAG: type II toxin-antitoxin system RelE/ParE family toxin [Tatlockia sp.]|nr:type II toxin-antitoxin system RelE/ParE family toxin [Tatlockia sp.]